MVDARGRIRELEREEDLGWAGIGLRRKLGGARNRLARLFPCLLGNCVWRRDSALLLASVLLPPYTDTRAAYDFSAELCCFHGSTLGLSPFRWFERRRSSLADHRARPSSHGPPRSYCSVLASNNGSSLEVL